MLFINNIISIFLLNSMYSENYKLQDQKIILFLKVKMYFPKAPKGQKLFFFERGRQTKIRFPNSAVVLAHLNGKRTRLDMVLLLLYWYYIF